MRSAVSSTTTGETGEAEECHGTRSRNVDDKSGLVARGTKTLVPSHEQLGSAEIKVTVESEAADEDSATGGPDLVRGIYPVIATISADGYNRLDDDELAERTQALIAGRRRN